MEVLQTPAPFGRVLPRMDGPRLPPNVLRRCVIGMRPNRRTKASIKPGWERGQLGRCIAPISANLLICTLYLLIRTYLGRVVPNHNIPRHDDPGGEF